MKKYNIANYIRYKEDVKSSMPINKPYKEYTRHELVIKFLPLVESLARKFPTSQQACGVLTIMDLLQCGSEALTKAVDRLDWETVDKSDDQEKTLKSFFSKRIRGGIRRRIDSHRGTMRLPEHVINKIRNNKDKKMVAMFFNSIFLSIDANVNDEDMIMQIPDKSDPYNKELLNIYLKSLMQKYLNETEYEVLRLSYGLDDEKLSAKEIASRLKIDGVSNYVRVSELKRQAVNTLIDNVDHSQVLDYV
jgi:RNA polymerase sigma factor (sigma-70 family)|tara:strand:+ start:1043 stop:1786 length:744 start_codon:yes stop_codon:yes gene_type:complete